MEMQVGDTRLRDRNQPLLLRFFAEIARSQSLDHIVLQTIAKTLANNRSRHMPGAKSRQARTLLVALDLRLSLAGNFGGGNLNRNFPLDISCCRVIARVFVSVFAASVVSVGLTFCLSPTAASGIQGRRTEFIRRSLECKDRRRAPSNRRTQSRVDLTSSFPDPASRRCSVRGKSVAARPAVSRRVDPSSKPRL